MISTNDFRTGLTIELKEMSIRSLIFSMSNPEKGLLLSGQS